MARTPLKTSRKLRRASETEIPVRDGSSNIFADIGIPNPAEHLVKAQLASAILAIIEEREWTQSEAANKLETVQPTVSDLRRGRFHGISVERLMGWLVALDQDVEIQVRPSKKRVAHLGVAIAAG